MVSGFVDQGKKPPSLRPGIDDKGLSFSPRLLVKQPGEEVLPIQKANLRKDCKIAKECLAEARVKAASGQIAQDRTNHVLGSMKARLGTGDIQRMEYKDDSPDLALFPSPVDYVAQMKAYILFDDDAGTFTPAMDPSQVRQKSLCQIINKYLKIGTFIAIFRSFVVDKFWSPYSYFGAAAFGEMELRKETY